MPQTERQDEARASRSVAKGTGIQLDFADLSGGVDYRSVDSDMVLEVTRFTNPLIRRGMVESARQDHAVPLGTGYDWWVTFQDFPRFNGIVSRLYPALLTLEHHDLNRCHPGGIAWWARHVPTLSDAVDLMVQEGILYTEASAPQERPSRLFISSSASWKYSGVDAALALLEEAVAADIKHVTKIQKEGVSERHLWLWTDRATSKDFRRALSPGETQLPSRPPVLPEGLTHLWCADDEYARGWMWDPRGAWRWITVAA